ncbi:hypothetical protein FOQG_08701 [Fusarium oxysporum f. sp. raphani 54005]|uniref:Uncharacterized protein n=7 Tax=Fusarium oxysporum TaxID=5507 RepID=W9IK97_FUSOX|nr:hypothetical protein FOXG_19149 [Fusarium oxysporum f. sp. lycopersici 4287]EWY95373.1 hypothetical protein FOYG_04437 [Fusarium oxysporum NRRL 32931]EXA46895.1 hypothetical protein FOVG_04187 [Fusarium oxysporum f. sp. pisi HDV247]EXK33061.1 hypothetical protein FOMG_11849 [Fusarium oxysporum f. sp. melonis 26406]EXK87804.1 hypothetical protein FOQG_08701 [Fusarium oxysporum f. sp. raphani 54005]EXL58762.1 hypothetical protein FOCG_02213 [Fusarium oxysporum f. sp. radicis-lycopersici 26381
MQMQMQSRHKPKTMINMWAAVDEGKGIFAQR